MQIYRQALLPTQDQLQALRLINYRNTPSFLGNFSFSSYGHRYGGGRPFPEILCPLARQLADLRPEQNFNAGFLQRYLPGQAVKAHRDPRSNIDHTLILVLGDFTGAETSIAGHPDFQLQHGDVLELECTINGQQGPLHSVSAVTSGERYTLILNTIL